jgi:hypothetical protein
MDAHLLPAAAASASANGAVAVYLEDWAVEGKHDRVCWRAVHSKSLHTVII